MNYTYNLYDLLFPDRPAAAEYMRNQSGSDIAVLQRFTGALSLIKFCLFMLPLWLAYTGQLHQILRNMHVQQGDSTVYYFAVNPIWMAFLLAMFVLSVSGHIYRLLLPFMGVHRILIAGYCDLLQLTDMNSGKLLRFSLKVIPIILFISLFKYTADYTRISDQGIYIHRFMSVEKYYAWKDVGRITASYSVSKSSHARRRYYYPQQEYHYYAQVLFNDRETWEPNRDDDVAEDAIHYILQQRNAVPNKPHIDLNGG